MPSDRLTPEQVIERLKAHVNYAIWSEVDNLIRQQQAELAEAVGLLEMFSDPKAPAEEAEIPDGESFWTTVAVTQRQAQTIDAFLARHNEGKG